MSAMCCKLFDLKGQRWVIIVALSVSWNDLMLRKYLREDMTRAGQIPLGWASDRELVWPERPMMQSLFSLVLALGLCIYNRKPVKIFVGC